MPTENLIATWDALAKSGFIAPLIIAIFYAGWWLRGKSMREDIEYIKLLKELRENEGD